MAFLPITLGVRLASDAGAVSSPRLDKKTAEKVFKRDDFTCRFCGFRASQYQRIVPTKDGGDPPFATACGFCEQCMALDRTGLAGGGTLIWLPEIGQAELNHIMRAIYVARASKGELAPVATRALDGLMARRADAKKRLGSDDPLLLATVMNESLAGEDYAKAAGKIDGIRLLPFDKHLVRTRTGDINQFSNMLKYWCSPSGPFGHLPADQWAELLKTATAAVGHA